MIARGVLVIFLLASNIYMAVLALPRTWLREAAGLVLQAIQRDGPAGKTRWITRFVATGVGRPLSGRKEEPAGG